MANSKKGTAFVTAYIEKENHAIHDVFAVGSSFSEPKSRYEAKDKHEEFMEALEQYRRIEGHNLNFNPTKCTWAEVVEELNKAHLVTYNREQREKSFHGRVWKTFTNASKIIQPALDALPDELCILHGGLAIVFNLVQRRERLREQILDIFGHIPEIISMACSKSNSFTGDKKLHNLIDELKVTLFDTIPSLVDALRPQTFLTKVTCPFRSFEAEELLSLIQRSARRLEAYTRDLQDSLVVEIYHDTTVIKKTTNNVQEHVKEIHQSISDVRNMNVQCGERMDSCINELRDFYARQITYALESQNGLYKMLKDVVSAIQFGEQEPGRGQSHPRNPLLRASSPEGPINLLDILDINRGQECHDLSMILRQSAEFDTASKSLLTTMVANPRFQRWITASGADLIYVEGHLDSANFGRTSPVSYICANLVLLFKDQPDTITLHFFCGQHVASYDSLQGPKGLMRSILAQFLETLPNIPLDNVDLTDFQDNYELTPMDVFCRIFDQVVGQVPMYATICCIIDDLTQFEKNHWAEDYSSLLCMLSRLIEYERSSPNVKVLVTSPTRSRWLRQVVQDQPIELTERG